VSNTRTFGAPAQVKQALNQQSYIASDEIATTVFLTDQLGKPLLLEGPAGVGKTELAKSVAAATGRELIRLQCYEGLDETKALYEWEYAKQLLYTQLLRDKLQETCRMQGRWRRPRIGWRRKRMYSSRCVFCSNARCSRRS
jgi:MoxR-like ATPase